MTILVMPFPRGGTISIKNAMGVIGSVQGRTLASGAILWDLPVPGKYTYTVTAPGYHSATGTHEFINPYANLVYIELDPDSPPPPPPPPRTPQEIRIVTRVKYGQPIGHYEAVSNNPPGNLPNFFSGDSSDGYFRDQVIALVKEAFDVLDIDTLYYNGELIQSPPPPPPPPPPPELPPADEKLGAFITRQIIGVEQLVTQTTNGILSMISSLAGTVDRILTAVTSTIPSALTEISRTAGNILTAVTALPDRIADRMSEALQPARDVLEWTKNFKFPDWDSVIVQPINDLLKPARDVLEWTKNFKFPDWDAEIVQPVIDRLDVWFSNRLGIDPKKPFWDEMRSKLSALIISILDDVLDAIIPEPPKREVR